MSLIELFLLAVGLSMDAFAVAVCKGLSTQRLCPRHYLIVGTWSRISGIDAYAGMVARLDLCGAHHPV